MKVAVLGAFGAMAEAVLYRLNQEPDVTEIVAADVSLLRAESVLSRIGGKKIRPVQVDVRDAAAAARSLKGCLCLVNCAWYEFNLPVMDLSLRLKAHYVDLGGLYHTTINQLKRSEQFKRAGILGILGAGSAPGISNMMTARLARDFDAIDTVGIYDASYDPASNGKDFLPPFSIQTLLDEHKKKAPVFIGGRVKEVAAHSLPETLDFKPPIGRMTAGAVIHSETATLPGFLRGKKVKNVFFKIAYPPALKTQLEILEAAGFSEEAPVPLNGYRISPRKFLAEMARQGSAKARPSSGDFEILRVRISGTADGRNLEKTLDCEMRGTRFLSGGTSGVGFPAAIAAVMALQGKTLLSGGVAATESVLDGPAFFKGLQAHGAFKFVETQTREMEQGTFA